MSYDITFIKKRDNLTLENIYDILEETDVKETDFGFFSIEFRENLILVLKEKGLAFEVFKSRNNSTGNHFEFNFPTYQVFLFDNQISISVPYWDENDTEKVDNEIKIISNVLLKNGLIGYDSQTEELIIEEYSLDSHFSASKNIVNEHTSKISHHDSLKRKITIAVIVIVVAFLFTNFLKLFG